MLRNAVAPVTYIRAGWIAIGLVVGTFSATAAFSQQPPAQPAAAAQAAPTARMFASDAGMVLNFMKPDKTTDFEAVMAKLKDALQKRAKPERKQQAATWKVFKLPHPAACGTRLCVLLIHQSVTAGA